MGEGDKPDMGELQVGVGGKCDMNEPQEVGGGGGQV